MALLPGSPALDAGDPAELGISDQRGVVRTAGVNIGAYQASASAVLLTAPRRVHAGVPFDVTVTAVDPFGQVAVGYSGTVTFSTSDPRRRVVLPTDYTFTLDDGGVHPFTDTGRGETTLRTHGRQPTVPSRARPASGPGAPARPPALHLPRAIWALHPCWTMWFGSQPGQYTSGLAQATPCSGTGSMAQTPS
jgi:hypothetical protein